ncbi:hypothetical protein [Streptococcus hillyeri]|uniref:Uncharacterized protein n=1 Tax=Streptococcus hillyeri TaxID=2282420 RepID=A0A3L9DT70_9STRE|nr:hypothetical protein [Streptococcus hillyeri]RLY01930.1 hypothetical protein EAF07_08615 [Streptococcus hillyeri]
MKELDVLKQLGLKDGELEEILGFQVSYDEKYTVFNVLSDISPRRLVGSKAQGWRVVLNGDTQSYKNNLNLTLKLPPNNPFKINGQKFFHRGHILAKEFYSFIKDERKEGFIKNHDKNGFIQFSVANMQQEKKDNTFRKSQAFYENKITEYLKIGNGKVCYEVKVLFYNKEDKIPIGTKISFKTIENNNNQKALEDCMGCNHIFIPNFDEDFDLSQIPGYVGSEDYREFYHMGYSDEHKKCFNNVAIPNKDGKVYDKYGNQVFYSVSATINDRIKEGIFLNVDEAVVSFGEGAELSVVPFTEQKLSEIPIRKNYYPSRNTKKNTSAVFFSWDAIEKLDGFAMTGLKKQETLIDAFRALNWVSKE